MNRSLVWFLSFIAAALTLIMLALHMSWVSINYILLSALMLFHGFYGLHTMLTEIWTGPKTGVALAGVCVMLGTGLFGLVLLTELVT